LRKKPFPAFVADLLSGNVIQILHSEIRAELDFEINQKAEKEVLEILQSLAHNTDLLIQLMEHQQCKVDESKLRALTTPNPAPA